MQSIINFISGKKTYITGLVMVILGALQGDTELIMQGFGLVFIRQGISKIDQ